MYKIIADETREVLLKTTSKKKLFQEVEEWKQIKKFNGSPLPFEVWENDTLRGSFNCNLGYFDNLYLIK